jgi:hypothetical protein
VIFSGKELAVLLLAPLPFQETIQMKDAGRRDVRKLKEDPNFVLSLLARYVRKRDR